MNLTTKTDVVALMQSSQSEREWNSNCDKVKAANGGYPDFWFASIVLSGVARKTAAGWGGDDRIRVSTVSRKQLEEGEWR